MEKFFTSNSLYLFCIIGFGLTAAAGTSFLLFDVHQKNRCDQHSFGTAVKHYITVRGLAYVGRRMHKKLEEDSQNIKQVEKSAHSARNKKLFLNTIVKILKYLILMSQYFLSGTRRIVDETNITDQRYNLWQRSQL